MDTSRLPSYRSSYLLRFHPYPRVKLSARERILIANAESYEDVVAGEDDRFFFVATEYHEPATVLHQAIFPDSEHYTPPCRQHRLSLSTMVVDLALMVIKRAST
ncbi:hypothetical protein PAXINDRAFT_173229 [Paxillus involutus ATCC 200175]|uniref:Uncharacterized protein n=1 Tax=Paxillus involutus ATCC 200175 TaxID=664439 RepID=A0A0C9SNG1_PAXIN|nr:hypothetical protein PAXINDRAFT_173229 [Paxillus involutus ATCC 200175]